MIIGKTIKLFKITIIFRNNNATNRRAAKEVKMQQKANSYLFI